MTEEDYKKLNSEITELVEYAREKEPFLCDTIFELYYMANEYLDKSSYEAKFSDSLPSLPQKEIYNLGIEFLSQIKPEYATEFQRIIDNNCINYHDPEINDSSFFLHTNDIMIFDIAKHGNLIEVRNLIHEFFHSLNRDIKIEKKTDSYIIFSEFVSIFFEYMFWEFLSTKNYFSHDIRLCMEKRKKQFVDNAFTLGTKSVLFAFGIKGIEINKKEIEEIALPDQITLVEESIKNYNYKKKDDIFDYKHFYGTLLANYVYKIGGNFEEKAKKVSYINDNMNKMTIDEIFDYLGIKKDENLNKTLVNCYLESERELIGINKI